MDRYQRVERPRPESAINENEIRITTQGLIRNYISYASSLLMDKNVNEIVLKAMGQAISKTVAIAEFIKKRNPGLYQDISISSTSITDVWEPIEEGLVPLETTRHVSMISITLSPHDLNKNSPGYQAPMVLHQPKKQYRPQQQPQYQQRQQQQPRQAHNNEVAEEESYGRGRGRGRGGGRGGGGGRGRGRSWGNRGGYGGYGGYGGGGYGRYENNQGYDQGYGYNQGYTQGYGNNQGYQENDGYWNYNRGRGRGRGGQNYHGAGYERGRGSGGRGEIEVIKGLVSQLSKCEVSSIVLLGLSV
ncbi:keratin, type II cytoskeletal 1-like [Asparagus officinalis]|uniref:keratin, type II cytoskeletal 1-like n=1 Tax=Asparagus officinalis TaxID=4686 RepID=UPI00098E175D|nr:keratin, type II cytoskeletal 1-like [Asparagus officinalis]